MRSSKFQGQIPNAWVKVQKWRITHVSIMSKYDKLLPVYKNSSNLSASKRLYNKPEIIIPNPCSFSDYIFWKYIFIYVHDSLRFEYSSMSLFQRWLRQIGMEVNAMMSNWIAYKFIWTYLSTQ